MDTIKNKFEFVIHDNKTVEITRYRGRAKNVTIPSHIEGLPVTVIGGAAFYKKKITKVSIPEGVKEIGVSAFAFTLLTEIKLPESLIVIEECAFYDCEIRELIIPDSVEYIGDAAFAANQLSGNIIMPYNLEMMAYSSFSGQKTVKLTIMHDMHIVERGDDIQNHLVYISYAVKILEKLEYYQ